jgi:GntR family transcriptional regulator/MocR family aminotransferase
MRMLYEERRSALLNAIRTQIRDLVEPIGGEAGMHLTVMLPSGINDVTISRKAARRGIAAMPLSTCYLKSPAKGGLILGYGGTNPRQINDGISKLRMCIQDR